QSARVIVEVRRYSSGQPTGHSSESWNPSCCRGLTYFMDSSFRWNDDWIVALPLTSTISLHLPGYTPIHGCYVLTRTIHGPIAFAGRPLARRRYSLMDWPGFVLALGGAGDVAAHRAALR